MITRYNELTRDYPLFSDGLECGLLRPVNKRERYAQKFGKERFEGMEKMMVARGKKDGINLSVVVIRPNYVQTPNYLFGCR